MLFRIIIVVCAEIFAVLGSLGSPFWGLLLFNLIVFIRPQDDRPNVADLHLPAVMLAALIVSTAARIPLVSDRIPQVLRKLALMFAFYLVMVFSAIFTGMTPESTTQLHTNLTVIITCVLILLWIRTEDRLRLFIGTMLVSGIYFVRMAISNPRYLVSSIQSTEYTRLELRQSINFGNPNYLGLLMVIVTMLALGLLVASRQHFLIRLALLGSIFGYSYVLLKAQSRGAIVAMAAGLIAFWVLQKRKILIIAIFVPVILIGVVFFAPATLFDRMQSIGSYEVDASATDRLTYWNIALNLMASNPVVGVGPNNFLRYSPNHTHNAYLQAGSEMGVPGAILYVLLLLSGYRALWITRRLTASTGKDMPFLYSMAGATGCALIAITVQGVFTAFAYREFVWMLLALTYILQILAEEKLVEPAPDTSPEIPYAATA